MASLAQIAHGDEDSWVGRASVACDANFGLHRQVSVMANLTTTSPSHSGVDMLLKLDIPRGMFIDTFELQVNFPFSIECWFAGN